MSTSPITLQKAIFLYILTALFLCFEMGLQVSPSVMTHQLMSSLQISVAGLGFMSGFYFYTYTAMQIPAGLLFDRFQVRWVIVLPLLICAAGALFFSFAHGIGVGSLGRLLMGVGSAFAFIAALVVAGDLFEDKHFALLAGITQMLAAFGAMLGEAPLLPIVDGLGWRGAMRLLAGIAVVLSIFIWLFVRYEGCQAFVSKRSRQTPNILTSLRAIMGQKQSWLIAVYACCLWAPMAAFASLWGVPYLETVYGLSHNSAAQILSLMWLGIAFGSPIVGWLSDRFQTRRIPLVFTALLGFICFAVINAKLGIPTWLLAILVFLAGAACSGQALSFAVVKDNNDHGAMAAAIGFNNMAVVIAGAIFQPLVAVLIDDGSATHFIRGIDAIVVCYLLAMVMAIFFIRSQRYR